MTFRMSRYRWIVFDADGTLFDYDSAEFGALDRTFEQYGLHFDAEVHRLFGEINKPLWVEFEQGRVSTQRLRVRRFEVLADALEVEFCASDVSDDYLLNLGAQCALMPGAQELVEDLSRDHGLALATNGIAAVQRSRFSASSIRPHFKALVISDEIGVAKPDPRFFTELFSRIEDPDRGEVLMVGDSLTSDIAGGVGFGIDTCWFNPSDQLNGSPVAPTYEVNDLSEILDIARGA
jgi:YjjG family noncanonical pyrimidine nucleotidase